MYIYRETHYPDFHKINKEYNFFVAVDAAGENRHSRESIDLNGETSHTGTCR